MVIEGVLMTAILKVWYVIFSPVLVVLYWRNTMRSFDQVHTGYEWDAETLSLLDVEVEVLIRIGFRPKRVMPPLLEKVLKSVSLHELFKF